jgi:hypothetical protein
VRVRTGILLSCLVALSIAGCATTDPPADPQPTVQSHFFPLTNGLIYTYSRFDRNSGRIDTLRCKLLIGQTKADPDFLLNTATGDTVYYIGLSHDAGGQTAFMRNGDTSVTVLAGNLVVGARWVADIDHNVYATDTAHYDDYYLPERKIHYPDVIVIEYQQQAHPDVRTFRFFAKDHGLIREVSLFSDNSEISSLQLLSIESPH